jgi:hypothetical protein
LFALAAWNTVKKCNNLRMCFAGEGCKVDCALALISCNASVGTQTSDGLTALHFAAQSGANP